MTDAAMMPQLRPMPAGGKGAKSLGEHKPALADDFAQAVGRDPSAQRETVRGAREPATAANRDSAADAPAAYARNLADALAALGAREARPAPAEGEETDLGATPSEDQNEGSEFGHEAIAAQAPMGKEPLLPPVSRQRSDPEAGDVALAHPEGTARSGGEQAAVASQASNDASTTGVVEAREIATSIATSQQADEPALREDRRREPATGRNAPRAELRTDTETRPMQPAMQPNPAGEDDGQAPRPADPVAAVRTAADDVPREDAPAPRVTVVASQTIAAPASSPAALPSPAQQLASAMTADAAPAAEFADPVSRALEQPAQRAAPMHSLTIQLQPAELGRVTARMTLADGQLAVAVVVETEEARSRIARDTDMIAGALRQAGYDVDRIVVQHVQPAAQTTQQGTADRAGQGIDQQAGHAREDQQRDGSGGQARDDQRPGGSVRPETPESAGRRGVYI